MATPFGILRVREPDGLYGRFSSLFNRRSENLVTATSEKASLIELSGSRLDGANLPSFHLQRWRRIVCDRHKGLERSRETRVSTFFFA